MNRLADLILNSPAHAPLLAAMPHGAATPGNAIAPAHVPIVIADAVSEFFFAGTAQENWEFGKDFPCCEPPVSPVFVELARPSRNISATYGLNATAHLPARWGWRFQATARDRLVAVLADDRLAAPLLNYHRRSLDDLATSGLVDMAAVTRALDAPDPRDAVRRLGGPDSGYFAAASIVRALDRLKAGEDHGKSDVGGLLHGGLVVERGGHPVGPVASLDVLLDHTGRPFPAPLIDVHGLGLTCAEVAVLRATILPLIFPAFMALSFLNTTGVTLYTVKPSAELARQYAEQGQPVPLQHFVMDIAAVTDVERN